MPDAFIHGRVIFSGIQKMLPLPKQENGFIEAWFILGNGEKYNLNKMQLVAFKPDAIIHPDFK